MTANRLMVAVDESEDCLAAIDVAAELARGLGGTLTLLAAAPVAPAPAPAYSPESPASSVQSPGPEQQELLDGVARERLDELVERVGDGIDVRGELSWGPLGRAVIEQAETGSFDLVVVAWPARGALGHLLHDHASRYVLEHSALPVLAVPGG